jgi:hypothetical protein
LPRWLWTKGQREGDKQADEECLNDERCNVAGCMTRSEREGTAQGGLAVLEAAVSASG